MTKGRHRNRPDLEWVQRRWGTVIMVGILLMIWSGVAIVVRNWIYK